MLSDVLRLDSDAPSAHGRPNMHGANTMCYQMARRFNIPSVFYEINGATGGAHQSSQRALHLFRRFMHALSQS